VDPPKIVRFEYPLADPPPEAPEPAGIPIVHRSHVKSGFSCTPGLSRQNLRKITRRRRPNE
jgi:hypothetical protein